MKTIFRYFLLMVTLLTTIQLSKGQTIDLGLAFEDSTMVKFVDSLMAVNKARGAQNLLEPVEFSYSRSVLDNSDYADPL